MCVFNSVMIRKLLLCLLLAVTAPGIQAQEAQPIAWESLNDYEQEILIELKPQWDNLPVQRQQQLQRGAQQWLQRRIRQGNFTGQRFRDFMRLNEEERQELNDNIDEFNALSEEEKQRIRESRRRFQDLPQHEQDDIKREYDLMTPQERRQFQERLRKERQEMRQNRRERIRDQRQERQQDGR